MKRFIIFGIILISFFLSGLSSQVQAYGPTHPSINIFGHSSPCSNPCSNECWSGTRDGLTYTQWKQFANDHIDWATTGKYGLCSFTQNQPVGIYYNFNHLVESPTPGPDYLDLIQYLQVRGPDTEVGFAHWKENTIQTLEDIYPSTEQYPHFIPGWDPLNDPNNDGTRNWKADFGSWIQSGGSYIPAFTVGSNYIRHSGKNWAPNEWHNDFVKLGWWNDSSNTVYTANFTVTSNTSDTLYLSPNTAIPQSYSALFYLVDKASAPNHDAVAMNKQQAHINVYGIGQVAVNISDSITQDWAASYATKVAQESRQSYSGPVAIFNDNMWRNLPQSKIGRRTYNGGSWPVWVPLYGGTMLEPGVQDQTSFTNNSVTILEKIKQSLSLNVSGTSYLYVNIGDYLGDYEASKAYDVFVAASDGVWYEGITDIDTPMSKFDDRKKGFERHQAMDKYIFYHTKDNWSYTSAPQSQAQIFLLSMYYIVKNDRTYWLHDTDSSYGTGLGYKNRWWFDLMGVDIGMPTGPATLVTIGSAQAWRRNFTKGIVFSKPRSSGGAITINLGSSYYNLNADGTYGAVVNSITLQDGPGGAGVGAVLIPTTQPPQDITPPTVSISSPSYGATVSGTVTVSANASDNVVVAGVQFQIDGNNLGSEDTSSPYSINWDTTLVSNGSHILTAVARDTSGNTAISSAVMVNVDNNTPADTLPPAAISNLAIPSIEQTSIGLIWTAPGDDGNNGTASQYDLRYSLSNISEANWSAATQINNEPMPLTAGSSQAMTVSGLTPNTLYYFAIKTADEAGNWSSLSNVVSATTLTSTGQPSTVVLSDADDAYITRHNYGNRGAQEVLYLRHSSVGYSDNRALIKFNLSSIAKDALVNNSSLKLYLDSDDPNPVTVSVYALNPSKTWSELSVTDQYYDGVHPWAAIGADNVPLDHEVQLIDTLEIGSNALGEFYIDSPAFKNLVQSWVNGSRANTGLILIPTSLVTDRNVYIFSSENSNLSRRPQLTINYTVAAIDTTPPIVSITSPLSGSTVSGAITVSADASDNVVVAGVQFKIDGNNIDPEDTSSPYSILWDTTLVSEGSHTLTAVARDTSGNIATSEIMINVNNVINHPPVLAPIGDKQVNENAWLEFRISAQDPDGDNLFYSVSGLPAGASFIGQLFYWIPNYQQAGTYSVTFTVTDGSLSDEETIVITVQNLNRPPSLRAIGNKTVDEGNLLEFTVSANDPDGDNLIYSAYDLPRGASFDNHIFHWTPDYNQAGTYLVTFTVSDGEFNTIEWITITVNNVNRPPVLNPIGNRNVIENEVLSFSVSAQDPDADNLLYSVGNLPAGASFSGQVFYWRPTYEQAGIYPVTFTVTDGGLSDSETITITVNDVDNLPPTITIISPVNGSIVNTSPVTVTGEVKDDKSAISSVFVNEQQVNVSAGSFTTRIYLTQGRNTIVVTARDAAGNLARKTITVSFLTKSLKIRDYIAPDYGKKSLKKSSAAARGDGVINKGSKLYPPKGQASD